jgi:energy-coupling factor transport system permease protein
MPVIYKIDTRIKIALTLLFTVLVFIVDKLPAAVLLLLSFLAVRLAGKIPIRGIKSLVFLFLLAAFIILMQTIFGPGENYIVKPLFPPSFPLLGGFGSLKWEGFVFGITIACRLLALMFLLPILTETTPPYGIACGLASFGINYRAAFIITTAFNLIPLFEEEGRAIMDAQKLRGMSLFERRSFLAKMKAYPRLVVPLVLGAMRKAQVSSAAMDSRAFGVYKTRTWLDKPAMKVHDYLCLVICIVFFVFVLAINFKGFRCPV